MIKLKKIRLQNYCGYKNFELNLAEREGVKRWVVFYGPNGVGKSNILRAVELLSSPRKLIGRLDNKLFLRRLTYHPNYNPVYIGFDKERTHLFMEAVFVTDDGSKRVVLENNWDDKVGLTVNELPSELISASSFIDSDNPNNMNTFQINAEDKENFLDMAGSIYNLKCYLPKESLVVEGDPETGENIQLYSDFVITKHEDTLVHYKSFSAGEKKIATLLAALFRRSREADVLLVDNIAQHIYYRRHLSLIEKIEKYFPEKQIIATTHSPKIIESMESRYLVDLEQNII